jgi:hypothetical protein
MSRDVAPAEELPIFGPGVVSGYLALSRLPGIARTLDTRTSLLAAELAAELSECRWCIERCRHDCRKAGIAGERIYTERERAALAFAEAVARSEVSGKQSSGCMLEHARRYFSEVELAELTAIVAEHHCVELPNPNSL